jgi:hypothetical protein
MIAQWRLKYGGVAKLLEVTALRVDFILFTINFI